MTALGDLYQDLILDHNASPRNFGELDSATHRQEGFNPLCGDKLVLSLQIDNDVIEDVRFSGSGCAISKASASLMTAALKGKTVSEAESLFASFRNLITGDGPAPESGAEFDKLGKLAALSGVRHFPSRVKCAALAWHTLDAALHGAGTVTTE